MTLTHIMPSLRRTLPDPLSRDRWPEFTVTSTTDVSVAGISLLCLVDWCGTPCVHTAAAVVPGTNGRPSENDLASVVITRVLAIEHRSDGGFEAWIDAELDGCRPIMSESRMIGRASTAHAAAVTLRPGTVGSASHEASELPADLQAGDIIAIPCLGATALHDVRPRAYHPERLSEDRVEHERDEFPLSHHTR